MTSQEFAYWLQGYFELTPDGLGFSAEQVKVVKDHLQLVFQKVTPVVDIPPPMFPPCVVDGAMGNGITIPVPIPVTDGVTVFPSEWVNPPVTGPYGDYSNHVVVGGEHQCHYHGLADAQRIRTVDFVNENGKPPASC